MIKLDYSLNSPKERLELVNKILEIEPEPSQKYLEILADYLVFCMEKKEKQEKRILTENRLTTVNKREVSFEGLVNQFESGENGVYNLVNNNKHAIFQPKIAITQQDREDLPELEQTDTSIDYWDNTSKSVSGKPAYLAKKALIETRRDQYVIKTSLKPPVVMNYATRSTSWVPLDKEEGVSPDGTVWYKGVSLMNPSICSAILCNYSTLKEESYGVFDTDTWGLMIEFDRVCGEALKEYPLYEKIVEYKIDGLQNAKIQQLIEEEFGVKHSLEYISSLWRKKIPGLIASAAEDEYLNWYYLEKEKGKYKKCSRCGQIKLAHNKYFSKNNTSKDNFYSICKHCRNLKRKK